jgi:hypothetical protein
MKADRRQMFLNTEEEEEEEEEEEDTKLVLHDATNLLTDP